VRRVGFAHQFTSIIYPQWGSPAVLPLCDSSYPCYVRVRKHVFFICALAGELRYDRPLISCLKPMQGSWEQGRLLPGLQHNFVVDSVELRTADGWSTARPFSLFSRNIQIDSAPATSKGLLLAGLPIAIWMKMFRASLTWKQHHFLCAIPLRIDVNNYF
jgi:hypothetical protein